VHLLPGLKTGRFEEAVVAFLSTYVNKVDKKSRVSVPASYRAALSGDGFSGIVAYPSLALSAIEAFGRAQLEELSQRQAGRSLDAGEFERLLVGSPSNTLIETILAMVHELPFDGEGRISLPEPLAKHAGISDRAVFVGRGTRFQIWAPEAFERHQAETLARIRDGIARGGEARP
jgi:MraZ protein